MQQGSAGQRGAQVGASLFHLDNGISRHAEQARGGGIGTSKAS